MTGSQVFNCANVPDSEHSHGSQPNGLLAFKFQKPSLQRSHWRPSTFCLHKHKTPGMLCRPQPGKSLRTPAGTHLHSSQYGKLNNPSNRETAVRFPLRRKTRKNGIYFYLGHTPDICFPQSYSCTRTVPWFDHSSNPPIRAYRTHTEYTRGNGNNLMEDENRTMLIHFFADLTRCALITLSPTEVRFAMALTTLIAG